MEVVLKKLTEEGGCIVSSADCNINEITNAQRRGDFWVDSNNMGFVRRLPEWLQKHSKYARNAKGDNCEGAVL